MSPNYVAPEVIEGRVSQWTDQYSLAVTYFQLRTGPLPFAGESVNQVLYAHVHEPPDLSGLPEEERRWSPAPWRSGPRTLADVPRRLRQALEAAAALLDEGRLAVTGGTTYVIEVDLAIRPAPSRRPTPERPR